MEFEAKYIDFLHVPLLTAQHITAMFFLFFSIWCLPHFYGYIISMKEAAGHSGCLFQTNRSISRAAHQTILPSVYRLSIILHPLLWFTLDEQRDPTLWYYFWHHGIARHMWIAQMSLSSKIPQYRAATDCARTHWYTALEHNLSKR
jgi:hypothetical protein